MDKLKEWLLEVAVKKMGPSAVRAGILGLLGWVLAKQDALQAFGIVADKAAQTITIHLDQLNLAVVAGLPAILGAVIKLLNHHADVVVKTTVDKIKDGNDTPPAA